MMNMTPHEAIADELHARGYSCSQSVLAAFSDVTNIDQALLLKISSGLGGGVAGMREVCGAVTGAIIAMSFLYAEGAPDKAVRNQRDYPPLQEIANRFREINGSIVCRELLGVEGAKRTRPAGKTCQDMVRDAARLVDEYIQAHPPGEA